MRVIVHQSNVYSQLAIAILVGSTIHQSGHAVLADYLMLCLQPGQLSWLQGNVIGLGNATLYDNSHDCVLMKQLYHWDSAVISLAYK